MEVEDFPECCGIRILVDLWDDMQEAEDWDQKACEYKTKKISREEIAKELMEYVYSASRSCAKMVATTNEEQQYIRPYLRNFGFRKTSGFVNPNTGLYVTQWELNLKGLTKAKLERMARKCYIVKKKKAKK